MRELDRRMGRHPNYTSRLLARDAHLRLDQLFDILSALGDDPAEFFYDLYLRLGGRSVSREAAEEEQALEDDTIVARFMRVLVHKVG
jgi:hypothetical protein